MKHYIFLLLISISCIAYGQTSATDDSIPPFDRNSIKYNERLDDYLSIDRKLTKTSSNLSTISAGMYNPSQKSEYRDAKVYLPELNVYTGPPLENNTFTSYPFANDYSFYSTIPISGNMWISTSSIQRGYTSMGATRSIGAQFNYQPADWIILSGGPFSAKNSMYGYHNSDIGVNGSMKFILNDRIRLNAFGQYSRNDSDRNLRGPLLNMYPHTFYGGSVEFKITDKFGLEGGVIRELNPLNGKWENRPYIAPVFYSK